MSLTEIRFCSASERVTAHTHHMKEDSVDIDEKSQKRQKRGHGS